MCCAVHGAGVTISCGSLSEDLRILHLPTANTLMMEALNSGQPSVVHNTAKFLEVSQHPQTRRKPFQHAYQTSCTLSPFSSS